MFAMRLRTKFIITADKNYHQRKNSFFIERGWITHKYIWIGFCELKLILLTSANF